MSGIKLKHGVWVLVADGEKALFLRNEGDQEYPNLEVVRQLHEENPPTHDQGTDRPGRVSGPGTNSRTAVADTDWHKIAKGRFADEIAERLYKFAHRGEFEHIILVAPPAVLGEMRKKMHKEVEGKILGEESKTLTGHTISDIEKALMQNWSG